MVYKFNEKDSSGTIEISRKTEKLMFLISNDEFDFTMTFEEDTLYDLIGALHSIQKRIKTAKEVNNG